MLAEAVGGAVRRSPGGRRPVLPARGRGTSEGGWTRGLRPNEPRETPAAARAETPQSDSVTTANSPTPWAPRPPYPHPRSTWELSTRLRQHRGTGQGLPVHQATRPRRESRSLQSHHERRRVPTGPTCETRPDGSPRTTRNEGLAPGKRAIPSQRTAVKPRLSTGGPRRAAATLVRSMRSLISLHSLRDLVRGL